MRYHIRNFIVCVGVGMLLLTGLESRAQDLLKHNWYFGNTNRAIRFNRVTDVPSLITNKAVPFGTGGSAVATDRISGNLLFYTDGQRVYDANNALMPNGTGLTGNANGNQPAAVCPVPGRPGKYFVFTNTASFTTGGAISYTIVDMNLFGASAFPSPPFGDVESKNTAIPGLINQAEAMITVPHVNGEDYWLITQEVETQVFNATLINAGAYTGTFNIRQSTAASVPTTAAHMAYHEVLKKVAVAPQDASTDAIVLGFTDTNGDLNFDRTILNSAVLSTTTEAIYDVEWSPSGRFIYLSRHGEAGIPANLFQYDYQNSSITLAPILPAAVFRSYGLQRAPDSTIYHMYQSVSAGPFLIGRIESPDSVASLVQYNIAPTNFATLNFDGKQFPGFAPKDTVDFRLSFTSVGTCQRAPTVFFPNVRPGADSLTWAFGDSESGSGWSPIHTYAAPGTYSVTLTAFHKDQSESVTQPVTINAFPLQLQLVQDTTACRSEFPAPRGSASPTQFSVTVKIQGGTPASINWSNGDIGATLRPDSAGYYYVVVTDVSGCSAYAGVNVKEYGLNTQTFNKWYFGTKAGIDFNQSPPVALNESVMTAPEGVAIQCDKNGQTLFYTDGDRVWDQDHAEIAVDIGGSPASTQSAIIIPVPDDETLYYIFTTEAINGSDSLQLKYSLFDLKRNAGKGEVVKKNVFMFLKSTERITASGQWLLVHELGNATFRSYPISANGIGNPVYTEIGTVNSLAIKENGEGYMKLGPLDLVAVPISIRNISNKIDLFHLNDTTGMLNNFRPIDLNEPNGYIYGIDFSPRGRKLYASVIYSASSSAIYEYYIDTVTMNPTFRQRIPVPAELGAIQTGPDGNIYVAVNNAANNTSLGTITPNEVPTGNSSFNLNGFRLAGGTVSQYGLPNLIQNNSQATGGPGITVTGLCAGDSTRFAGTPRDIIDEYSWRVFRDGAFLSSTAESEFALLLPGPGNYSVTLQLHNRCAADTVMSKNFVITSPPANPSRGVPLCNTPTVTLDANPANIPGLTYRWNRGQTTETIDVSTQGVFTVVVSNADGCSTTGTFLTADSRPIFDLGPDITICEDNNTAALNVQNPGMTYAWTINGAPASTASTQSVNVTLPGVFTYAVRVTDPVTNCFRDDDKTYTINVAPSFTLSRTNPTSCGTATGQVQLNLTTSTPAGGPLYSYFLSGPGGASQDGLDQTAPNTFTLPNVRAGTYSAIVQDQISQCTISQTIGLDDAQFTAAGIMNTPNCDPPGVTVQVTLTPNPANPVFPVDYTATNSTTGAVTSGVNFTSSPFSTSALTEGDYTFELIDDGGCIATFDLAVVAGSRPALTITPDLCALTLTAGGGTPASFAWTATPPNALVGPTTGALVNLAPNTGTVSFTVTGTDPSAPCPGTETITLNVGNLVKPTLAQTDECATQATMTASPAGTFNYRWFTQPVGAPGLAYDPTIGGRVLPLTEANNGTTYQVQIFEPQSGCTLSSDPRVASVQGIVDVNLTSTPPCKDDKPFTLTALTQASGTPTFSWSRNGTTVAGAVTRTLTATDEGQYTVVVSKADCRASGTLQITRAALPEGNLPNFAVICDDAENTDPATSTIALDPGVFVSYEWSKSGVLLGVNDRVLIADSKGEYSVRITDANQCTNIDRTDVRNDCLPTVDAPTAFRPSSKEFNEQRPDLKNADFWVYSKFIEDEKFAVFIFNRWGEMVYSSSNRYFKWNGGMNGDVSRPLPPGTYAYVIQYISAFRPDEGIKEKRGGVALIR